MAGLYVFNDFDSTESYRVMGFFREHYSLC